MRVLLLCLVLAANAFGASTPPSRSVALTFDDLPDINSETTGVDDEAAMTEKLVGFLAGERLPAIGFVNEEKLLCDGTEPDPRRVAILARWLDSGIPLGNHTYGHLDLDTTPLATWEADVIDGERVTRSLCDARSMPLSWFRHPYLDTGRTLSDLDQSAAFLAVHGYRIAPVTIDDSEWIYDIAYARAAAWRRPFIRASYVRYMRDRFAWSERKSREVFGREIPQILLLHASSLNADAMPSLIRMIRGRGYSFVTIEAATKDPAYLSSDRWTGGGVSWIERWAVTRGMSDDRFENDPVVPVWIQQLAGAKDD